jgi:hypothetical protein
MRRTLLALSLAAAAVAAAASLRSVSAAPPEPSAYPSAAPSAYPSAAPPAPQSPAATADGGASSALPAPPPRAPRRFLEGFPDGEEPSPRPKSEAWGEAPRIEISRARRGCTAFRIREYVRITCLEHKPDSREDWGPWLYGARVAGGSEQGVEVVAPKWEATRKRGAHGVDVVIPVRRGDRRAVVVEQALPVRMSAPDEAVYAVISETWLPGAPGPTIVIE